MSASESLLNLPYLGRRVSAARQKADLTQAQLSEKLGFKDRQTLSAIESDDRRLSVSDLKAIMEITGCSFEFFTDPFRIVGEGGFSYRASGVAKDDLDKFEEEAGKWLALSRYLSKKRNESISVLRPKLALSVNSTFEEAQSAGEQVARELNLGTVPAERLATAIEQKLNILVLYVDMPKGVSGAAVQLNSGDSILINRKEAPWRQAFDLAHELFHVLTWDAMLPERVDRENPAGYKAKRIEQLADNFAGALLIPSSEVGKLWAEKAESTSYQEWLIETSFIFRVSVQALYWRMVALGLMSGKEIDISKLKTPSQKQALPPVAFSYRFLDQVAWGIENGEVSVRRVLDLLKLNLGDLRAICQHHHVRLDIGL